MQHFWCRQKLFVTLVVGMKANEVTGVHKRCGQSHKTSLTAELSMKTGRLTILHAIAAIKAACDKSRTQLLSNLSRGTLSNAKQ